MNVQLNFILAWSLRLWMVLWCFEGVLRYELDRRGLGALLYLRDALLVVVLFCAIAEGALIRNLLFTGLTAAMLLVGGVVGLLNGPPIQVAFGFKILLAACTGIAFGCSQLEIPRSPKQATVLCIACLAGVLLNMYWRQLPWTGATQEVMGVEVVNSLDWTHPTGITDDIIRPAGFSRGFYCVATQLLVLGILVMTGSSSRWRFLLWLAVLFGIVLTTSKGAIFAWLIVTAAIASPFVDKKGRWAKTAITGGMFAFMVLAPSLIFTGNFEHSRFKAGTISAALTDSFIDRLSEMWPEAFALTESGKCGIFLGRGVGVGTPARYFQPDDFNASDNLFVYFFQMYGLLSLWILLVCLVGMLRLERLIWFHRDFDETFVDNWTYWLLALSALSFGIFSSMIEDSLLSMCLGAAVGRGMSTHSFEPDDEEEESLDV